MLFSRPPSCSYLSLSQLCVRAEAVLTGCLRAASHAAHSSGNTKRYRFVHKLRERHTITHSLTYNLSQ